MENFIFHFFFYTSAAMMSFRGVIEKQCFEEICMPDRLVLMIDQTVIGLLIVYFGESVSLNGYIIAASLVLMVN